ncbi:MAG: hypothetical protein AB7R55_01575 [Gemmatimonadales bacterium]
MTNRRIRAGGAVLLGLAAGIAQPAVDARPVPPAWAAAPPSQARGSATLLLTEVRFNPNPDDTAFVELLNAGDTPLDLLRFVLRVGGGELPLPRLADSLAPGARLTVWFDGSGRVEGTAVHAGQGYRLLADSGAIELLRDDDRRLDRVAWGGSPGSVSPGIGGLVRATHARGGSIGRPPGANTPGVPDEWVSYGPSQVTPGEPNPLPPVQQLLPLDGVVIESPTADLAWYPVPGAARYRVQVAADSSFERPVVEQTVTSPTLPGVRLPIGAYLWRVRAVAEAGDEAPWSGHSFLEVAPPEDQAPPPEPPRGGPSDAAGEEPTSTPVLLSVPYLRQHKDTKMLLLEQPVEQGAHAWDVDHVVPSWGDPADTKNCAVANVAMISRFFQGDLSQDRIGYEVLSRNVVKYLGPVSAARCVHCTTMPGSMTFGQLDAAGVVAAAFGAPLGTLLQEEASGPERDLVHGRGLDVVHSIAAFAFALGAPPDYTAEYSTKDDFWNDVTAEIDAQRPVVGANWRHAFVVRGYEQRGRRRFLYINDPANGEQRLDLDAGRIPASQLATFKFPSHPRVAHQEPEVTRDGDGDGVVDFDELERFKTNPMNPDTDQDGVKDKQDIASGVFESEFRLGYAWDPGPDNVGRDFDDDGLPTELDADSDWPAGGNAKGLNDGCLDGDEDKDGNGKRTGNESSNFNPSDDLCDRLSGTLTYSFAADNPTPESIVKSNDETVVVRVKLKPDPNGDPGQYVDDGSTFTIRAVSHLRIDTGDPACTIWARERISTAGPFDQPDDELAGYRGDTGLTVGVKAERPTQTFASVCAAGSGPGQGEWAVGLPECLGTLSQTQSGQRTYVFDCTTKPSLGQGWTVTRFSVRGFVKVR